MHEVARLLVFLLHACECAYWSRTRDENRLDELEVMQTGGKRRCSTPERISNALQFDKFQ
jgi:hypothetical protein